MPAIRNAIDKIKPILSRYGNIIFFVGGFLFDSVTIIRIDSVLDIAIQFFYLSILTGMILWQAKHEAGVWTPSGRLAKIWAYETEIIHFFYGGLLSAYVILYFKSTSLSRSVVFLSLVGILMFANEMPQIRKAGNLLRLGLYALCVVSFLNYFIPIVIGRMGWWVFLLAWGASLAVNYYVLKAVARLQLDPARATRRMGASPLAVLVIIFVLYFAKLIPPVPLSVQYMGIYHAVEKNQQSYQLTYRKPPWYQAWRKDDVRYLAREGDRIFVFARVFAPARFEHEISMVFFKKNGQGKWIKTDRIPLAIHGGRAKGYRGYATKENFDPGDWRVEVATEDDRTLGVKNFKVFLDTDPAEPKFARRTM